MSAGAGRVLEAQAHEVARVVEPHRERRRRRPTTRQRRGPGVAERRLDRRRGQSRRLRLVLRRQREPGAEADAEQHQHRDQPRPAPPLASPSALEDLIRHQRFCPSAPKIPKKNRARMISEITDSTSRPVLKITNSVRKPKIVVNTSAAAAMTERITRVHGGVLLPLPFSLVREQLDRQQAEREAADVREVRDAAAPAAGLARSK